MGDGARLIFGHYQRHAIANSAIWKPYPCSRCGQRHGPEAIVCPERADLDVLIWALIILMVAA